MEREVGKRTIRRQRESEELNNEADEEGKKGGGRHMRETAKRKEDEGKRGKKARE